MAYPAYIREKARKLRVEKKLTIDELAERLAISRTTIYYWVRDLPIPRANNGNAWPESARCKGNERMQTNYRMRREQAYELGRAEFESLKLEDTFLDFVSLYLAEGFKRSRNTVSLGNSDPLIIALATYWIRRFASNKVWASIQFHADQDLEQLRAFWAPVVGLAPDAIRMQRKSNSSGLAKRTWRSVHGVLTVGSNDTYLRARLQGWIDCHRQRWLDSLANGA